MRWSALLAVVPVVLLAAACSSGNGGGGGSSSGSAVLDDLDPVAVDSSGLAASFTIASAPSLYALVAFPAAVATTTTDGCPIVEVTDFSTVLHGPCTDAEGREWSGELRMSGFSDVLLEMDQFQFAGTSSCGTFALPGSAIFDGKARVVQTESGIEFTADLTLDPRASGCPGFEDLLAVDYAGEAVNGPDGDLDGEADFSIWNGLGRVGLLGAGRVRATTVDERLDGIAVGGGGPGDALGEPTPTPSLPCFTEAASGSTLLEGGGSTAEIAYDGGESCDGAGNVRYLLDGVVVTSISGVACSATPTAGRSPLSPLIMLAAGLLILALRRR